MSRLDRSGTERVTSARRRAVQAVLAAATIAGGVALAAHAADASPKPQPTAKIRDNELVIEGTDDIDVLGLRLSATDPDRVEIDFGDDGSAEFDFKREKFDRISVGLLGGDDTLRIDDTNGVFTDAELTTVDGGDGDDVLLGGGGAEAFRGGAGDDLALMGGGDDAFVWAPGDDNDTVEGQAGADTLDFQGSDDGEAFVASAVGPRVIVTRDLDGIVMDLDDVETVALAALGGVDNLVVGDLSGTDLADLAASNVDNAVVNGTNGDDQIAVSGNPGGATVAGPPAGVTLSELAADDTLTVNAIAGDDLMDASGLAAGVVSLSVEGGLGGDVVLGGAGDELVDGGDGDDVALLGAGDDTVQWDPG